MNFESNAIDYQQSVKLVGIDTIVTGGSRAAATSKMECSILDVAAALDRPSYLNFDIHIHFVSESIKLNALCRFKSFFFNMTKMLL